MFNRSRKFTRSVKKDFVRSIFFSKIFIVSIILIFLSASFWLFYKYLKTSIEVEIDNVLCTDENNIRRIVEQENVRLYWFDRQEIENKLKQDFPCINMVYINYKFPLRLRFKVLGKKPVAVFRVLQKNFSTPILIEDLEASSSSQEAKPVLLPEVSRSYGETFIVDEKGIIFGKGLYDNLPFIDIVTPNLDIGDTIGVQVIQHLMQIWQFFNTQGRSLVNAELEGDKLTVKSNEEIVFSMIDGFEKQGASLQLIWKQAKINSKSVVKIDLRFDKPVVVYASDKK